MLAWNIAVKKAILCYYFFLFIIRLLVTCYLIIDKLCISIFIIISFMHELIGNVCVKLKIFNKTYNISIMIK